ncbi:MAG TPA: hypothetical protein VFE48_21695 [Methylomirabilota bacterium]|nr:hypothetical protein [Methylomirabilota bacterium]
MRVARGSASLISSTCLPAGSAASAVTPVTLPPGRASLSRVVGSPSAMTTGTVEEAWRAARIDSGAMARITSTWLRTSSCASPGRASTRPAALRTSDEPGAPRNGVVFLAGWPSI